MPPELDLRAFERGSVTAPAGCGKTQLIADTLDLHADLRPILLLTHTNAGVAALRGRLQRARVPGSAYRVATIDGFAMRLIGKFPMRSGHAPRILELNNATADYAAIRAAALGLIRAGHVSDALRATYCRVLVDEYQDCNQAQHGMIAWMAQVLPTCVLGDPMQAIFDFGGNQLVNWVADVQTQFPAVGELSTPWRWRRTGTEDFGNWLLDVRARLQAGQPVDLRAAPPEVQWIPIGQANADAQRRTAALTQAPNGQTVLIIGDSRRPQTRFQLTSQTPGASTVETVDLADMVGFAQRFDPAGPNGSLAALANYASSLMTGVGPVALLNRVETLLAGRARTLPTLNEHAAMCYVRNPSLANAAVLLNQLASLGECRVFRHEILRCSVAALETAAGGTCTLHAAALQVRERNRFTGRPLPRRAVGSTLLLKGLESDIAVILQPEEMSPQNLYVAMTRGSRKLVICSPTPLLNYRP